MRTAVLGSTHVCDRRCLRWTVGFGRRWYYCALVPPVVVKSALMRTAGPPTAAELRSAPSMPPKRSNGLRDGRRD